MDFLMVVSAPFLFFLMVQIYKKCSASCLYFADAMAAQLEPPITRESELLYDKPCALTRSTRQLYFF
ncbi:MAG: hypothetical protein CMH56_03160 [Myxococcales bacterium]|nr:hypothetical protein [Myxococcales bacterium]|tara:strand:- start:409 stop:609 length:201 start_codon:yes stop_codon:yes gene_type:complete